MSSASQPQSVREIFAGPVTREDRQLLWMLAGMLAVDIAFAAYLSMFPTYAGGLVFIVGIVLVGSAVNVSAIQRLKGHYSSAGLLWLLSSIAVFLIWNMVVMWVSLLSGWWAPGQTGYHVGISAVVGLVPLVLAIWLFGRKLRQAA